MSVEPLYFPSFLRRTKYVYDILAVDHRRNYKVRYYFTLRPNETPKLSDWDMKCHGEALNKVYFELLEKYPDEELILEMVFFVYMMDYAPSTVANKMSKIRRVHKLKEKGYNNLQISNIVEGRYTEQEVIKQIEYKKQLEEERKQSDLQERKDTLEQDIQALRLKRQGAQQ